MTGIPHKATSEDIYKGMRIPRGAVVVPNMWFAWVASLYLEFNALLRRYMLRDTRYFDRPDDFNPDRFREIVKRYKTPEQALNGFYPDDPSSIIFGFGRRSVLTFLSLSMRTRSLRVFPRICPGRYFADMSLWLIIACTLAVFDIKPYVNPDTGVEELPEIKFSSGETSHVHPFKCRVVPRSEYHVKLVMGLSAMVGE